MPNVHIVTDSSAHFANAHFVNQQPITVVSNRITIAGRQYREGVDLSAEEAFRLLAHQPYAPAVTPPQAGEYLEVYQRLARNCDAILSIHASREMYGNWHNAKEAAQQLGGSCKIMVIDSQTFSAGLGMLVRLASKALAQDTPFDEVVRIVRGAVERCYSVFYAETTDYLLQNRVLSASHTILGAILGVKPFLAVEEGRLKPMEKVRTRIHAVERLVEFAVEFTDIDDALILQHKPFVSEQTRMLQERLAVEFPGRHFPHTMYGPSLAALVGIEATGLVILESETRIEDDF
jgi:DegV family protein with EDD domain